MKKIITIGVLLIVILGIVSCKKNGTGGKATIKGYVKHHEQIIPMAKVYIKYGATEFPGTDLSLYDANVTANANAYYEIKDLRMGDYYLYGVGYDNTILESVFGGIPVKIKYSERKKEMDVIVPVVE